MSPDTSVPPSPDAEPTGEEVVQPAEQGSARAAHEDEERPGARLGLYTLVEPLGEGGFGTVWVAEQTVPVRRRVALKLLKPGMASREILARFAAEQQALALMDHPAIAGALDAGSTPSGRPFFVMELVPGQNLTTYADQRNLDLPARLELFCEICHGIQHAHQKGVVHRDLKPDNVLVVEDEGRHLPRVIDFGIAKALQGPLTDSTLQTGLHQIMGTPDYMPPEQATHSADVDTRADVYALGAMLYELLTGQRTFDLASRGKTTLSDMLRLLREVDPPRPSERVASLEAGERDAVAARRGTSGDRLPRALRGDLDWIVMRALEKDRDRRYEMPALLAADLRRHLSHEPVLAGPPSTVYRLLKLARRHRGAAAGAAVAAVGLVGALIVLAWSVLRVSDERDLAQGSRDAAERSAEVAQDSQALAEQRLGAAEESLAASRAVTRFLGHMLGAASPDDLGLEATVLSVLDRAAPSIGSRFADRPYVESELRLTVGTTYRSLGHLGLAREHLERAVVLSASLWGDEHPDTLVCRQHLALVDWFEGDNESALAKMRTVHERLAAQLAPDDDRRLEALNVLGIVQLELGDPASARAAFEEVLAGRQARPGASIDDILSVRHNLALVLADLGEHERAFAELTEVHEQFVELYGDEHPDTLSALNDLAIALEDLGRYGEATQAMETVLERRRRVLGTEHPLTISTLANLSTFVWREGRFARAHELADQAIEQGERVLGADHGVTLQAVDLLGSVLMDLERIGEARPFIERAYEGRRRTLGEDHPDTLISLQNLGVLALDTGDPWEAQRLFEQLLEARERTAGELHPETLRARFVLSDALYRQGRSSESADLLRPLLDDNLDVHGASSPFTADVQAQLAWVLLDLGKYDEAEDLFQEAHVTRDEVLGSGAELTVNALEGLARLYRDTGRETEYASVARLLFGVARKVAESEDATPWDFSLLAWYLSTGPLEDVYDIQEALVWAERANEASGWSVPRYLDGLASVRFAAGDLEGALEAQRQALALTSADDEMRGYHEEVIAEWEALQASGE